MTGAAICCRVRTALSVVARGGSIDGKGIVRRYKVRTCAPLLLQYIAGDFLPQSVLEQRMEVLRRCQRLVAK